MAPKKNAMKNLPKPNERKKHLSKLLKKDLQDTLDQLGINYNVHDVKPKLVDLILEHEREELKNQAKEPEETTSTVHVEDTREPAEMFDAEATDDVAELQTRLKEMGLVETMGIIAASGAENLQDFTDLDADALAELVQSLGLKPVQASKLRRVWNKLRGGATGGVTAGGTADGVIGGVTAGGTADGAIGGVTGGRSRETSTINLRPRLIDPSYLPGTASLVDFKVWRTDADDWYSRSSKFHDEQTMYLALVKAVPTSDKIDYQKDIDSEGRTVTSLLEFLDRVKGRDSELEASEDIASYRSCVRAGRTLRDFRVEWERRRKIALRTGRMNEQPQDFNDFLQAAQFSEDEVKQIRTQMHKDKLGDPKLDELKWVLQHCVHLEFAASVSVSSCGGVKSAAVAAVTWSSVSSESQAFFTKGLQKGKGGGAGKGKGKGKDVGKSGSLGGKTHGGKSGKPWAGGGKGGGGKGGGGGGSRNRSSSAPPSGGQPKVGGSDRPCPNPECGAMVFGSKLECFKCGTHTPPVHKYQGNQNSGYGGKSGGGKPPAHQR